MLHELYAYVYYPLALAVMLGTLLDWTPRARRDTFGEGAERAWFYVSIWTVVPTQVINWGAWRAVALCSTGPATAIAVSTTGATVAITMGSTGGTVAVGTSAASTTVGLVLGTTGSTIVITIG